MVFFGRRSSREADCCISHNAGVVGGSFGRITPIHYSTIHETRLKFSIVSNVLVLIAVFCGSTVEFVVAVLRQFRLQPLQYAGECNQSLID